MGPRLSLTDVEATAVQVALYRYHGAAALLRPDGLPYYDASYDKAMVEACLSEAEQARLLGEHSHMLGAMAKRTAEIDYHILAAVLGPVGSVAGSAAAATTAAGNPVHGEAARAASAPPDHGSGVSRADPGRVAAQEDSAADDGRSLYACGGVRQVVLLGAGLDSRAWRLPLPLAPQQEHAASQAAPVVAAGQLRASAGSHGSDGDRGFGVCWAGGGSRGATADAGQRAPLVAFFELDSGGVEGLKTRVLGRPPRCRRVFVRADLAQAEQAMAALGEAGHDASRPTVFVAEGLIGYLTAEAGDSLLRHMRRCAAPGSALVMTVPPSASWRDELAARGVRLHHVTYEEPEQTLARTRAQGWDARLLSALDLGRKYRLEHNNFTLIVGGTGTSGP